MESEKKFPALNLIAGIYGFLSIIVIIAGVIAPIYILVNGYHSEVIALSVFLGALFLALGLAAISEIINVFLNIEENTRETANNTKKD